MSTPTGITVRPLRWAGRSPHPHDLDLVAEAYREYETALTGTVDAARADLEGALELPDCDRSGTGLLVEGDEVVGSVYVQGEHLGKDVYVSIVVTTDGRRRRATEAGVAHAVEATGRIVAARGEPGWTLRLTGPVEDEVMADVVAGHGLERVRQFFRMQIDSDSPEIPSVAPPLPPGVELVVRDDEETRRAIWAADNEVFLDHWNFTPSPYEDWWEHFSAGSARDPEGWWLITVDGEPAAFCILDDSRAELRQGYVSVLGVRRAFRGRGLATLLLQRAFVRHREMGRSATLLGVDAESLTGAVGVYERVGMRPVRVLQGWARELS